MTRVTAKDVARAVGVSQATVSYVLNGRADQKISDHVRGAVLAAADRLGYVPSAAAQSLRTGRSAVVLCLLPELTVSQATEVFKVELSRVLAEARYSCVYLHLEGGRQDLDALWPHVHPAVVIALGELAAPDVARLRRSGVDVIDGVFGPDGARYTGIDQVEVGRIQVRHLAARGHRRIGFAAVVDPREDCFCTPRREGVQEACRELGLPDPVVAVLQGADADSALLAWRAAGVDAVAAFNDLTALAVLRACHDSGVAVPSGLAVIGVDDLEIAALVSPRLTTIQMDLTVPAQLLARRVIALVEGTEPAPTPAPAESVFRLVVRESA